MNAQAKKKPHPSTILPALLYDEPKQMGRQTHTHVSSSPETQLATTPIAGIPYCCGTGLPNGETTEDRSVTEFVGCSGTTGSGVGGGGGGNTSRG